MTDYTDESLVYVDPRKNAVIGNVEWSKEGNVVPKEMPFEERPAEKEGQEGEKKKPVFKGKPRKPKTRYFPWCSYKTAKKLYRVEGKQKEVESQKTLDDVLERALKEPFWDE